MMLLLLPLVDVVLPLLDAPDLPAVVASLLGVVVVVIVEVDEMLAREGFDARVRELIMLDIVGLSVGVPDFVLLSPLGPPPAVATDDNEFAPSDDAAAAVVVVTTPLVFAESFEDSATNNSFILDASSFLACNHLDNKAALSVLRFLF
ncbi:hypothetical protein ACM66B_004574 [Microbotryomycetes sp. NB124-2]